MNHIRACIVVLLLIGSRYSIGQQKLIYDNYTYSDRVKTVQLTPSSNRKAPAVARVGSGELQLSFDWLGDDADYFTAKIINCDRQWQPSGLSSLEFLNEYNEFNLNSFEFSFDNRTPYVHFVFDIPVIKRSGNYLLIIHRTDRDSELILSRRIRIVSPLVQISPSQTLSGLTNLAALNQQVNFKVRYPDYRIDNPLSFVNVVIRQNQRDDNAVNSLKPAFVREDIKELEYRFFDHQNTFAASNEFRFFDLRSLVYPGQNVRSVDRSATPPGAVIEVDRPRTGLAYAELNDNNGQAIISPSADINGLYANVTFSLDAQRIGYKGDVYVFGELTDWKKEEANRMNYDSSTKAYRKTLLLKEGYYEYQYLMKSDSIPEYYLEGNHAQSENSYEIFVYYKPPNERSDLIIGYVSLSKSGRNR